MIDVEYGCGGGVNKSGRNMMDNGNSNKDVVAATTPDIIKVIGVGGGGGNAVNHMYDEGIDDVNFLLCNTDGKALADSKVPHKLQLGVEGLGAGNRPEHGKAAAEDSIELIRSELGDGTKMVFITAGMGGGTGTGAAPVIAREAMDMGILTVGIVTIPFRFEGCKKIDQALDGVDEMAKNVDALLVINNERLRDIYPMMNVLSAFAMADDTLSVAVRSISEIITMHGVINLDFKDVKTFLKDGGVAIMSMGRAQGEGRVTKAIQNALNSPLLNNTDIYKSKKVLFSLSFSQEDEEGELMMEEVNELHAFMENFSEDVETKMGLSIDDSLNKEVKITVLATGFGMNDVPGMAEKNGKLTEEERLKEAEDAEKKAMRREGYYGRGAISTQRRHTRLFLFDMADLDNEEIVSLVEATPTFKRTTTMLNDMKEKRRNVVTGTAEAE